MWRKTFGCHFFTLLTYASAFWKDIGCLGVVFSGLVFVDGRSMVKCGVLMGMMQLNDNRTWNHAAISLHQKPWQLIWHAVSHSLIMELSDTSEIPLKGNACSWKFCVPAGYVIWLAFIFWFLSLFSLCVRFLTFSSWYLHTLPCGLAQVYPWPTLHVQSALATLSVFLWGWVCTLNGWWFTTEPVGSV